jgi:transposase
VRAVGRAIGLAVHRDFCEVAIVESGVLRSAGRIATTPEQLELFAGSLGGDDRVALEVTGSAWEIARILEPHVVRVVVVSPADTGIRQARAKTDRLDARALARLLAAGELDAVWSPDEWTRVLRRRLARREQLVRARSRAKNEIQAVLVRRLVGRPPVSDLFGVKGREWLRGLELPVEEAETVAACMRHVEFLDAEIAAVERHIARQALDSPELRRLMTVPGVNVICAATFLAAVGDIRRFRHRASWSATSGLTRACSSPAARRPRADGSPSRARPPRAGRSSRRPGRPSSSQAPCARFTSGSAAGAAARSPSSRSRASSRRCSGACCRAARTTPTSSPR